MTTDPPADLTRLPARRADSSKRDYGRVVVVGGSAGMAGAPALAAMAALKSGAGLVEIVAPEGAAAIAATFDPCAMARAAPAAEDGTFAPSSRDVIAERVAAADAVAVGPGIGRTDAVRDLVVHLWHELPQPAVFDADALWALAQVPVADRLRHAGPRVLTPHAGEMARLLGAAPDGPVARDRDALEREAAAMAGAIDAVVVLKGAGTLVVDPRARGRTETGNAGMATAGTGDVLTGVTAALLAQGMDPFAAARLAAWVHGRAGDVAAVDLGQVSMTARDLLERLHVAFREAGPG
ncbi:MAG: NAD(P)H-hydrate dehydratase [Planctomycetaceae bacterium]